MSNQNNMPKHKNDRARLQRDYSTETARESLTPEQKFNKMFENFKLQTIKDGTLRRLKDRKYFMKPGERKRKKRAEAEQKARQNQKRRRQGK